MHISLIEQFKILVSGYYGITEMDEYDLKVYLLKDIENYIRDFLEANPIENFDYKKNAEDILDHVSLKRKLQVSLLVLHWINAPIEIVLLVKARLKSLS